MYTNNFSIFSLCNNNIWVKEFKFNQGEVGIFGVHGAKWHTRFKNFFIEFIVFRQSFLQKIIAGKINMDNMQSNNINQVGNSNLYNKIVAISSLKTTEKADNKRADIIEISFFFEIMSKKILNKDK